MKNEIIHLITMIERVELIEMLTCSNLSLKMGKEMKEPWLIKKEWLLMIVKGSMRRRASRDITSIGKKIWVLQNRTLIFSYTVTVVYN